MQVNLDFTKLRGDLYTWVRKLIVIAVAYILILISIIITLFVLDKVWPNHVEVVEERQAEVEELTVPLVPVAEEIELEEL